MSAPPGSTQIRYTTDGQAPTVKSTAYDGRPLQLTTTTQIRAQAFAAGAAAGPAGTGLYVARAFDMTVDLPIVLIDAYGHGALARTTDRTSTRRS